MSISNGVDVRQIKVLRGPNMFAYMPVLHVTLDIGEYEYKASDQFPEFIERLTSWLPGLEDHECSLDRPGGFIERLRRGTYLAHITEHVCIELQNMLGFPVSFGKARGTGERGVYSVVIAYKEEEPAKQAFQMALELTLAAMHGHPYDFKKKFDELMAVADEHRLGPSTAAIVNAARKKGIPVLRLRETSSLVQLGYGVNQKRISASETTKTSAIAVDICQEKPLTNKILRTVGLPVPDGACASSPEEAWEIAQRIGLPVVVKPENGNQGKGVSVNLKTKEEVVAAYVIADQYSQPLVETYIEGSDHRMLVIDGKMVAAARREPAHVIGDGIHNVEELVTELNKDPRRRPGHCSILTQVTLDASVTLVLEQQGLTLASIPEAGQKVFLRTNCNLSTGGTATDVTDIVHASNARIAELAAEILGLDVAGIDVLCKDISRPLREQNGAIVEVNAAPGLRMHLHPSSGTPRDVGKPIVDMLYPDGSSSRIPIIAVTGTNGKTTVTRLISHIYETARWVVGMTCTEGTYINGERIIKGDCSGPKSAQAVLLHPHVEVAVLETARGGILREGLAFDWCTVGVVTNISGDHLGIGGINTIKELAKVKQVVVEAVHASGAAVLNADDRHVAEMAAATDSKVVYFGKSKNNPVIQAHLAENGDCVFIDDGMIVLTNGTAYIELIELDRLSFTMNGAIPFQLENALAATAAAWAAGVNPAMIARGLSTFETDSESVPGRFNIWKINGIEIVLDYGHNASAMVALQEAIEALGKKRTVMVLALPGDRRDEDIIETAKVTTGFANKYILHDLMDRRGRNANEIPSLIQRALPDTVTSEIASDQKEAIVKALSDLRPGERLVIIADEVEETISFLNQLKHVGDNEAIISDQELQDHTAAILKSRQKQLQNDYLIRSRSNGWGYNRLAS